MQRMMSIKKISAMAGETAEPITRQIWRVIPGNGEPPFEVSGELAARRWVEKLGGRYEPTGRYEIPSIS